MTYWIDSAGAIVGDEQAYVDDRGTTYPPGWPKGEIPGLRAVVETPRPDTAAAAYTADGAARGGVYVLDGAGPLGLGWEVREVAGVPTQVWITEARPELSPDEAAALAARDRRAQALAALDRIDAQTVRPLRAVLTAQAAGRAADPADLARLTSLEAEAQAARAALAEG